MPSSSAFDPPRERFETVGELGRGGMGRVEDAVDRALGRPVAIKQLLSTEPEDLARFEREARITARLEHPGIVPIHDAGRAADGTPYYVMRRVDGRPLDQLVANKSLEERLALVPNVLAACDAAGYAHARGVIHRDIKPSNILIGPFGETLLIDWGLAREIGEGGEASAIAPSDPSLTRAGTIAGTPGFMSPEQARGESVDARADVFALGATLFQVLAGRSPYAGASATQLIDQVGRGRGPDWRLVPRGVPADLRAILMKSMAPEPGERYADAGALSADLRRFVAGNLVGAYRYGRLEQLRRFVWRHRGVVAASAIGVAVAIAIGVVSIRSIIEERERAEAGEREAADARDDLLVAHAQELASTNPIAAIATLRDLPAESERWPQAWAAAVTAYFHGVPSGFTVDPAGLVWVEVSPDGRHVVVVGRSGIVELVDIQARTHTRVLGDPTIAQCSFVTVTNVLMCRGTEDRVVFHDPNTRSTRTLAISGSVRNSTTDGHGHAWLMLETGDVVEVRPDSTAPDAPIATKASEVTYAQGAERLVVVSDDGIFVRDHDRAWPLAKVRGVVGGVDGSRIVIGLPDRIQIWNVKREPQLERDVPMDHALPIALVGDTIYIYTIGGIETVGSRGLPLRLGRTALTTYGSADGAFVAETGGGELFLADHTGWFSMPQPTTRALRVALSSDHRFLVSGTASGVVQFWDLRGVRPASSAIERGTSVVKLTASSVWTYNFFAVTRHDRVTGATREIPLEAGETARVSDDESYVVGMRHDEFWIVDVASGRETYRSGTDMASWAVGARGIVVARRDGRVDEIDPHDGAPHELGTLPKTPQFVAAAPGHVVGVSGRMVCRVEVPACATIDNDIDFVGIDDSGQVWALAGTRLWGWPLGGDIEPLDLGVPIHSMVATGKATIAYGASSLVVLRPPYSVLPAAEISRIAAGGSWVAFLVANSSEVSVLDTKTSVIAHLPATGLQTIATDGVEVFGTDGGMNSAAWKIDIPHDPAALRRWLDDISNARRVGAGVVAFPD